MTRSANVAEQSDFSPIILRNLLVRTAKKNIRLNADGAQLFDGMLRRFGFELTSRCDVWQERQVDIDCVSPGQFIAQLPDRLEERQPLDIADRATDLAQQEI